MWEILSVGWKTKGKGNPRPWISVYLNTLFQTSERILECLSIQNTLDWIVTVGILNERGRQNQSRESVGLTLWHSCPTPSLFLPQLYPSRLIGGIGGPGAPSGDGSPGQSRENNQDRDGICLACLRTGWSWCDKARAECGGSEGMPPGSNSHNEIVLLRKDPAPRRDQALRG